MRVVVPIVLCLLTAFPVAAEPVTISVVATTDVHGRAESLPWLSGHLANLRAARAADGGGVVLVDAGDMFQGTLESNLGEGAIIVRGYNALGYTAVAIGNHEFDFGPAGPRQLARPNDSRDDPRGALKARARQARFPFLGANLQEKGAAQTIAWHNVRPSTVVTVAGARVAIVGVTTASTPVATHPRNFAGLEVRPLIQSITAAAQAARAAGARIVIVAAHAGGECGKPEEVGSCKPNEEIFAVARGLAPGLVDMIAAGHTHQMVAHKVNGIAIVQAMAEGRAFGRVDLTFDDHDAAPPTATIFPPRPLCGGTRVPSYAPDACAPLDYEGRPVVFDAKLARALAPDVARAQKLRARPVGITLASAVRRMAKEESPLGNLAADLMRSAAGAEVAFINGGSLRSDLPAGPLTYGRLYEAFPFDDGLAPMTITAGQLAALVARNLERSLGILSLSGVRAEARCDAGKLGVTLLSPDNQPLPPDRPLRAVTNGYLASGGDALLPGIIDSPATPDATPMRDRFAALLGKKGGTLDPDAPPLFSPSARRLVYPGVRPVRCAP